MHKDSAGDNNAKILNIASGAIIPLEVQYLILLPIEKRRISHKDNRNRTV
jgi:hypothetical protein